MKHHLVTVDSVWPTAIKEAQRLFATPQQLEAMRRVEKQMFETGALEANPFIECRMVVRLQEDESIAVGLRETHGGHDVVGGRWMIATFLPAGDLRVVSGQV